jgi:sugar/nucleoside kinase (ribokinase family)
LRRPDLLVLGHVTRDEVGGEARLGGAAGYAAAAGARLGIETALVTVGPPDDPLLARLREEPGLAIHCVPDDVITTFALAYAGGRRTLSLRQRARALSPDDVPPSWRDVTVAYVGPVAGECDAELIRWLGARFVGAGLQGWLRRARVDGTIEPDLRPEAVYPPAVGAAIVSEEDHPEVEAVADRFAGRGAVVAVTRGARGAVLRASGARLEIPAVAAREVDPTGAGDVFGVVLTLELASGAPPAQAAAAAARAAALVVEGPWLGALGRG